MRLSCFLPLVFSSVILFGICPLAQPTCWGQRNDLPTTSGQGTATVADLPIDFPLANERIVSKGQGISQVFVLGKGDQIYVQQKPLKIRRPVGLIDEELAYINVYFLGAKGVVEKGIIVLIAGYKTEAPRFFIDHNNNLDFTDDGKAEVERDGDHFVLKLNGSTEEASFFIRLLPFRTTKGIDDERKKSFAKMFEGYRAYMGGTYADVDDWFFNQRLNTRTASVEVDGEPVMIGLLDYDCDGLFDGEKDRFLIGPYEASNVSYARADGAVAAEVGAIFMIGDSPYRLTGISSDGLSVSIKRSEIMPDRLFVGSKLPEINVKPFSGDDSLLANLQVPGKFLVLDFWGHWCAPCVAAIPETVAFQKKWEDTIEFVGIHNGETSEAIRLLDKHGATWRQFEFNDELEDKLFIDAWPTYVLVSPEGSILSFRTTMEEIERTVGGEIE